MGPMQLNLSAPFAQVPTAPHVSWSHGPAPSGVMLYFNCAVCGDISQKPCENPRERAGHWIATYAAQHTHGRMTHVR